MAKGANAERQVRRKNRPLKDSNQQVLPDSNLDKQDQKVLKDKKKLAKATEVQVAEKENTPILRRSKRKVPAVSASKLNADLLLTSKTSKSKIALKNKEYSTTVINEIPDKTQSNSNSSPVVSNHLVSESSKSVNSKILINTPSIVSDDSGFESSTRVSNQIFDQTLPVLHSPSSAIDETCILTSGPATLSYWMELAEQRRISLEIALQENELLHDQLAVLVAENSQLKQLVKEAEEFAEVVKDSFFVE